MTCEPSPLMTFAQGFVWTLIVASLLMQVRNHFVYRARMQARALAGKEVDRRIKFALAKPDENRPPHDWVFAPYRWLDDGPSYDAQMWDLTKWRFRDFYPELVNEEHKE
jgi:hypothetical protein